MNVHITYTLLINDYVKVSDINSAGKFFSKMEKAGIIEPSTTTCNVLMGYCVKKKDIKQLQQIFNKMTIGNIQPDIVVYGWILF